MDKIYLKVNYLVIESGGETYAFGKNYAVYSETTDSFIIRSIMFDSRTISILFADAGNYYDETGTIPFTESTLRDYLRANTGFKTPPGGSGGGGVSDGNYGDISVSGGGTIWDINPNVVNDANIHDVDASKVTQDSTHRFITDAQLANLANQSGVNSGDETTGTIQTKLGVASTSTDGYLTQTDWNTFNNKENALGFTPVPDTNTITINGSSQTLGSNPSFSVSGADPGGWTTIVKSANQDVENNSTPVDDTDLQFSVVAGGHYMVELNLCYSGNNTTGDYRWYFAVNNGIMEARGIVTRFSTSGAPANQAITAPGTAQTGLMSIGVLDTNLDYLHTCTATFNFYCSDNATFVFQFCNQTAGAGRISRTWKGSILKYKRID